MKGWLATASLALGILAAAALAALGGMATGLGRSGLSADVALHPFVLPSDFGLDADAVAAALVTELQDRLAADIAIRLLLEEEENTIMGEVVLPRLINAGVFRRIFAGLPGIGSVTALTDVRAIAQVTVRNTTENRLTDIALLVPGLLRGQGGLVVPAADGPGSVTLPALAPGESADLTLWLATDAPPLSLGAAGGLRGDLRTYRALTGWRGADLQVMGWARWLVAGLLGLALVAAAAGLFLSLFTPRARGG
jgi:hypothetical protein